MYVHYQEIGGQWGDFTSMLAAVHTVVQESETRLAIVTVDEVSLTQVCEQLEDLKVGWHRDSTHTHMVTQIYTHTHVHTHLRTHMFIQIYKHTCSHTFTNTNGHTEEC